MTVKGPAGGALRTRPADPSEPGIRDVLLRNLDAAPPERISWLYLTNPCGRALVWVAEREGSLEPVATSAAHRRAFRIDGREALALNLSDFAIDAAYRTLGPALGLLRATLAAVKEPGVREEALAALSGPA